MQKTVKKIMARYGTDLELTIVSKTFDRYEQTLIRDCIGSRIPADLDRSVVFAG